MKITPGFYILTGFALIITALLLGPVIMGPSTPPEQLLPTNQPEYITTILAPDNLKVVFPSDWVISGRGSNCLVFDFENQSGQILSIMPMCLGMDAVPDDCPDGYKDIDEISPDVMIIRYTKENQIYYGSRIGPMCYSWVIANNQPIKAYTQSAGSLYLSEVDKVILSLGFEP